MPLSKKEQDHYAALAARAEAEDYAPIDRLVDLDPAASTTPDELDALLRELEEIPAADAPGTPAGSTDERANEKDALELAALGRPSLSGRPGSGPSPKRQVRLSRELDAALTARALKEHRNASDVIRDALDSYLRVDA